MKYLKLFEELSTEMASKAFGANRIDDRTSQLKKDILTHLFKDYIGKDIPFFVKTRQDNTPTKYTLIEVEYRKSDNPITSSEGYMKLYFSADNDVIDDAPFIDGKKDIIMEYSILEDNYINESKIYHFNQYAVNFLIKAANIIRNLYFNSYPRRKEGKIVPENEQLKRTKLSKEHFTMFHWVANNMLNK